MKKTILHIIALLLLSLSIFSCTSNSINTESLDNKMLVHYIDVGQGDSILIQVNNKNLLIDAGPKSDKEKLFSYLSSLNINKFDYVIATHPHEDHIGNMSDIIKSYTIDNFYSPKVSHTSRTYEKMIEALQDKNLKINPIKENTDSISLGANTTVEVFSPIKDTYDNLNSYSPIIKIKYKNISFLFTGDSESSDEKSVLSNNKNISADVLKVGHHGSSTSTSMDFLNSVNPSIAVISVGTDNKYNHPSKDTLDRLNSKNIKIYQTNIDGTILLTTDGEIISKVNR